MRCASESITIFTPAAAAARACTSLQVAAAGLALISRNVPVRAAAAITASMSKS